MRMTVPPGVARGGSINDASASKASACARVASAATSSCGSSTRSASLKTKAGEILTSSAIGSGSIQAIYNAIDQIFQHKPQLVRYEISALTSGEDAQAEVYVTLEDKNKQKQTNGVGVDFDVLQASAKAYITASSQLKEAEER